MMSIENRTYIDRSSAGNKKCMGDSQVSMMFPAYSRWDIVMAEFGQEYDCCMMRGYRPALVLSKDSYNEVSPIMVLIPLTKKLKGVDKDYHVFIDKTDCIGYHSSGIALIEQIRTMDRRFVNQKIGEVSDLHLKRKILEAVSEFFSLDSE